MQQYFESKKIGLAALVAVIAHLGMLTANLL
jgi:hypothetical protein